MWVSVAIILAVCWLFFSFWVGGQVGDATESEGWATFACVMCIVVPIAILIGVLG